MAEVNPVKHKEKILIVDDEETIRNLFLETLEGFGYRCDTAQNGLQCLEKFYEQSDFDVVLLDVQMPKLNGIETLKKLKSYAPDISIIMVSASREIENVREALKEGAYDYIFKPFNINDVEAVIRRAVERAKLIKENKDYQKNLEKKVADQTRELVNLYSSTLEAMILALDLREQETGYHSYRVTEYALKIAKKLNLDDNDLAILAKGALLHDIGKIGVPDHILLKPGALTDDEWKIMKMHPENGYKLLQRIDFLEDSAQIVLSHHERADGTGYPRQLKREDIPFGARIFSVVDALDAMTSERTYRKAMPFEKASEIIVENSGTQFDPEIVEVFQDVELMDFKNIRDNIAVRGTDYIEGLLYYLSKHY